MKLDEAKSAVDLAEKTAAAAAFRLADAPVSLRIKMQSADGPVNYVTITDGNSSFGKVWTAVKEAAGVVETAADSELSALEITDVVKPEAKEEATVVEAKVK